MERYSKYSSTLIKNWLLKNGCKVAREAHFESKYLCHGNLKIRISTHLPSSPLISTLYIMIPVNNVHSFGVYIGKNYASIPSIKELKSFLKALFVIDDIKAIKEITSYEEKIKEIPVYLAKIKRLEEKIGHQKFEIKRLTQKNENA